MKKGVFVKRASSDKSIFHVQIIFQCVYVGMYHMSDTHTLHQYKNINFSKEDTHTNFFFNIGLRK